MKRALLAVLAVLCLALNACSQQALVGKMEPQAESTAAKAIIDQLRSGDIAAVKARLDPKYLSQDIDDKLHDVAAAFPEGKPESVKIVGAYTSYFSQASTTGPRQQSAVFRLTYEYQFKDAWVEVGVVLERQDGKLVLEGLQAKRMAESLETRNAFNLAGKSAVHWLVLALAAADVLLCLFAFVLCLRTPIARRKWLWALFTLLGVTTLRFDWSNGHFAFQAVSVQLFSASAMAQPYGPWMLGLSIPLGAIWFLAVRRRLIVASAPPPLPDAAATP